MATLVLVMWYKLQKYLIQSEKKFNNVKNMMGLGEPENFNSYFITQVLNLNGPMNMRHSSRVELNVWFNKLQVKTAL